MSRENMYKRIVQHGEHIKRIFCLPLDTDPIKLCKKLRRLERKAEQIALDMCNIPTVESEIEKRTNRVLDSLDKLLNFRQQKIPIFLNRDPRGYSLKIDDEYVRKEDVEIHKDWGGYGIIAPDLTND